MDDIKAIIFDLDGTLLNNDKDVSSNNLKALDWLKQNGIPMIFATARPPRTTQFPSVDLSEYGSMIYYNGGYFFCLKTNEWLHHGIDKKLVKQLVIKALELDPHAKLSVEIKDQWYSHRPLDYTELMQIDHHPIVSPLQTLYEEDVTKILLTHFSHTKDLIRIFKDKLTIMTTDDGQLVQIMAPEADKYLAVSHILSSYGLTLDEALCFGDDYNDLGLFKRCGVTVAMGNAVDALKKHADYVTTNHHEDGIFQFLKTHMMN